MRFVGEHARATYIYGIRPAVPEEPPTEAEVALWREKWAAECSDKVARLLCALERDYAPR